MSDPVNVVVRRKVKPGREADYEAWLSRLTEGAASQSRAISVPSSIGPAEMRLS